MYNINVPRNKGANNGLCLRIEGTDNHIDQSVSKEIADGATKVHIHIHVDTCSAASNRSIVRWS